MAVFNLLQACPINFANPVCNLGMCKFGQVTVAKLAREDCSDDTKGTFLNKLENSLMRYSGQKRQRLGDTLNRLLDVQLFYFNLFDQLLLLRYKGYLRVRERENGIFRRFVGLCGGVENISVNLMLEFGTKKDKMTVNFKDSSTAWFKISAHSTEIYAIDVRFNLTDTLAKKWDKEKFLGKLTLSFSLNDEALNLIHRDNMVESFSDLGTKMLEIADSMGDAIIVAKNRKKVRCHKAVLISQNEVFKMMFDNEVENNDIVKMTVMTEAGVRALLAYLYCRDIKDALECSLITWELVMAADKYKVVGLLESMKDVILNKANDWFDVTAALYLWYFAKKKIASVPEDDRGFKEILDKAVCALRSKPEQELEQCQEFKEILRSSEIALEMCIFLLKNK